MAYTTIDDPSAHFQTALWTGDGATPTIANDGNSDMQPDWLWGKNRTGTADHHYLIDTTRGTNKYVFSNSTSTEITNAAISSINSDGFVLTTDVGLNRDGSTFVGWQWKANGGTRTTYAESGNNPAGGYQVNTTAGFSIVDWTGTGATGTVAHGLGAVPHVIIVKCRNSAHDWAVYHHENTAAPETDFLVLNATGATTDQVQKWQDTAPTSTNITFGDGGGVNANNQTHIAYVFTEIQGYSKFGKYTGNGNDNGPFLYTGFKPAMFFRKRTNGANNWNLWDSKRAPFNEMHASSALNTTDAEDANTGYNDVDFLANGIKIHDTGDSHNGDGFTYVYWAWAESPFVSSEGVPTTAR